MTRTRIVLACLLAVAAARAQSLPPDLMNYQGVLRDASGAPVTNVVSMVFRLFDAPTGGSVLLSDTHAVGGTGGVSVVGGLFNVQLGAGQIAGALPSLAAVFSAHSAVYLEITIQGETLSPRTRILASAYAHNSGRLQGASLTDINNSISGEIATHAADPSAHHARYTDAEAVAAMGLLADSNPLNHTKWTPAEILQIVRDGSPSGGEANGFEAVDDRDFAWDGIRRAPATWAVANATCLADGGRLPSVTELVRNNATTGTGNLSDLFATEYLWTAIQPANAAQKLIVRLSDGDASVLAAASTAPFRCVWPVPDSGVFDGDHCNGPAGAGCEPFGLAWNVDRVDRRALDYAAAVNECRMHNASVTTSRELEEAIQLGLPNGTNLYLWASDGEIWIPAGGGLDYGMPVFRWPASPSPNEQWYFAETTYGTVSTATTARPFRCIGRRSAAIGVPPSSPSCNGGCFTMTQGGAPIVADSADRAPATQDVALETCRGLGGTLPYLDEFAELVHDGWPGATNTFLWTSDTVERRTGVTNQFGYGIMRFSGVSNEAWIGDGGAAGTFDFAFGTASHSYRCIWHHTLEATATVCLPNQNQMWNGSAFSCVPAVNGNSGGNSQSGDHLDVWGNVWDAGERAPATYAIASSTCDGLGGRLPTATEIFRMRNNPPVGTTLGSSPSPLWTTAPTTTANQRVTIRLSDGAAGAVAVTDVNTRYRCVWPVSAGDVLSGPACYGGPADSCFEWNGMRIDRYDRPALSHPSASYECRAAGGRLPDQDELQNLIHAGAPNGSNAFLYVGEIDLYFSGQYGYQTARWNGPGYTTWVWGDQTTTGDHDIGTELNPFRCVFNNRVE